jgi:hypothetical protein
MEELEYLIRALTYKRSCLELDLKNINVQFELGPYCICKGKIEGLSIAISEIYKLEFHGKKSTEIPE